MGYAAARNRLHRIVSLPASFRVTSNGDDALEMAFGTAEWGGGLTDVENIDRLISNGNFEVVDCASSSSEPGGSAAEIGNGVQNPLLSIPNGISFLGIRMFSRKQIDRILRPNLVMREITITTTNCLRNWSETGSSRSQSNIGAFRMLRGPWVPNRRKSRRVWRRKCDGVYRSGTWEGVYPMAHLELKGPG